MSEKGLEIFENGLKAELKKLIDSGTVFLFTAFLQEYAVQDRGLKSRLRTYYNQYGHEKVLASKSPKEIAKSKQQSAEKAYELWGH